MVAGCSITTGMHRGDQHQIGREFDTDTRPGYGYPSLFHRLPYYFLYGAFKFRQFVEEQYAVMCSDI